MKIKVVANYDNDKNIYNSVLNCFGIDKDIKLTLGEDADFLVVINGYDISKTKYTKNNIIGILQEPIGNANYDRNLHFYCSKIFCQSSKMFNNYKNIAETPLIMFYTHHTFVDQQYFINFDNFEKRKKICIIMSSLDSPNNISWKNHNYSKRKNLVKKLLESDLDFDFYGRGWSLNDKRYKGETKNKHETLRQYEFSIAVENVCETNYTSEKLFDCFINNTVPLYYGCPNVSSIYEFGSYETIDIESNDIIKNIKEIIKNSNKQYKNKVLESKKLYFNKYNIYNLIKKIT